MHQLRYFEAVARYGGFTRAAEQLHVAQPAVSAQIRRLEAELGVALFTRTTRRVALTQAGELFLARTRRAMAELEAGRGDLADLAYVLRGRVALGSTQILGAFDLPTALASFAVGYPGVTLSLRLALVTSMVAALDVGDVDFVLGPVPADLPATYAVHPLVEDRLVLITPPSHRLARRPRVALAEVAEETFVCLPADSGLRGLLNAAATAAGFVPCVQFETSTPSSVRELVSAGLGVAMTVASAARNPGAPVNLHDLDPSPRHPPYGLIHHNNRELTPAARTLRDHLVQAARSESTAVQLAGQGHGRGRPR